VEIKPLYTKKSKAILNKKLAKQIGDKVKRYRLAKGYSMVDLAGLLDTQKQSVYKIENGEYCTSIQTLRIISEALDCDLTDLIPSNSEK